MDFAKILAQLHAELANLDAAIQSLERLQKVERPHPPAKRPRPKSKQ
jgi:hypothetical protein